jgi:hypothetical protein
VTPAPALAILEGANQPRSEPMPQPLTLAQADHDLLEPAVGWLVHPLTTAWPPAVELIASIQSSPTPPIFPPTRGQTATTLAIQMDAQVAIDLYRRIALTARSMGWQLPPIT